MRRNHRASVDDGAPVKPKPPADSSLLLTYRAQNSRPGMSLQVRVTRPSGPYSVAAVDDVGRGLHRLVPRGTRRRRLSRGGIALCKSNNRR